ncbi:MAG TPA: hypothetical protein ENN21_04000, partial [Spirochaetes bacterium]|nr:hypothetical protein [Spirochaetota bacterium]
MEHFNGIPPKGVKEKNMYILHLDTPRIIILCSVILGVVVISFLLGMNLFKSSDKPEDLLATRDKMTDFTLPGSGLDNNGMAGEETLLPPLDNAGKNNPLPGEDRISDPLSKEQSIASLEKNPGHGDILTSENIKDILPPLEDT